MNDGSGRHPYLDDTPRIVDLYVGVLILAVSLLLGYFGVRGALMYLGGSREAPADPVAVSIGILAGIGGGYVAIRLLTGWGRDGALLPTLFLLVGGLGALAGAVWFFTINRSLKGPIADDIRIIEVFGGAGIVALFLCWSRWRNRTRGASRS